jgi:hypothetical protein
MAHIIINSTALIVKERGIGNNRKLIEIERAAKATTAMTAATLATETSADRFNGAEALCAPGKEWGEIALMFAPRIV